MMRTETFKRRTVKQMRNPLVTRCEIILPDVMANLIRSLPVVAKDKGAKAALIRELLSIEKELRDARRRYRKAADTLERLSVGQALMPRWGDPPQK